MAVRQRFLTQFRGPVSGIPIIIAFVAAGTLGAAVPVAQARPIPINESQVAISYQTGGGGGAVFSGMRGFDGIAPVDATVLGGAPNVKEFNSVNTFGRRTALANNPVYAGVLGANESLISHAFFKINNNADFFPGLTADGSITLSVTNIQFAGPVTLNEQTLLMHVKWNDQNKLLTSPYIQIDDHHTQSSTFRDFDGFLSSGFFGNFPSPNYILGNDAIIWTITGNGTDTLGVIATFPYSLLKNLEETGQTVPDGLPAPQGFLEPFHFHIEYVVTPEPGTLLLLGCAGIGLLRRRRNA